LTLNLVLTLNPYPHPNFDLDPDPDPDPVPAGDKLIDHLKHWMNPEEVSGQTVPVAWQVGEQPAVAAAILELFHLLPAQSAKFMETEGAMQLRTNGHGLLHDARVVMCVTCSVGYRMIT